MLVRRDLFNVLNGLNKIFDERSFQQDNSAVESGNWVPSVDIKEEPDKFLLHIDVPGVNPDLIDVSMENDVLTIKGSRSDLHQEEKNGYHRVERVRGSFYRRFTFPDTADAQQISAKVKQGVLEIAIGKKKASPSCKVKIKVED